MNHDSPEVLSTLVSWSMGLFEPLLSFAARSRISEDLAALHAAAPEAVHLFFGGFLADLAGTLPATDPWRRIDAKLGSANIGEPIGARNIALVGETRFGTWENALDISPLVYRNAAEDPALVALFGDDLTPEAAFLVAAAGHGYQTCSWAVERVWNYRENDSEKLVKIRDPGTRAAFSRGADLQRTRHSCEQASRWLTHRRRAYVGPGDPWPAESSFRWAWRAQRQARGQSWSAEDVDSGIAENAIGEEVRARLVASSEGWDSDLEGS